VIRAVVFDLDGTLADTSSLATGRRVPSLLISGGVSEAGLEISPRHWAMSRDVSDIPATLLERGYCVAVATRAPLAYASTLLHLIDADYQILCSSCGAGLAKAEKLRQLCRRFDIFAHEMLYCGDLPEDRKIAEKAGVRFLDANSLHDSAILEKFPQLLNGRGRELATDGIKGKHESAIEYFQLFERISNQRFGPIPQSDVGLLERYLELAESSIGSAATRAAISAYLLSTFPALSCRRQLQHELFSNVGPIDRDALLQGQVINGRFGLVPRLITRRELRVDTQLREEYLSALRRVWPPLQGLTDPSLSAAACYDKDEIGKKLSVTKHYKRHNSPALRMSSGPDVMLEHIHFVSDLVASRLEPQAQRPLVPVPASAYSISQPGQFSVRLTRQVAATANRDIQPILRRVTDHYEVDPRILSERPQPLTVDLIEDQITTGTTIAKCREALKRSGIAVAGVYCYSANSRVLSNFARPGPVRIESRIQEILEEHVGD